MIEQFRNLKTEVPSNRELALKVNEIICSLENKESPATDRQQLKCAIELLEKASSEIVALDIDSGNCADLVSAIDNFVATAHV
jgi:hypothetical protein